jgi:hypothetical protein
MHPSNSTTKHATSRPTPDNSSFKENILILLFVSQIYNILEPVLGKGAKISVLFTDAIQSNALSSLFIASTFFLATNTKPSERKKRLIWGLALCVFAAGFFVIMAKIWLAGGVATPVEPPEHY